MIVDKKNLLPHLHDATLELGCGSAKKSATSVGIDVVNYDCVDIVGDVYEVLDLISASSVQAIYSSHFFEHVRDVNLLLNKIARILKPGGMLTVVVPHFSNPYFFSDYSHQNFFGLYSFSYFAKENLFRRKVPNYAQSMVFGLIRADLIFKSSRPFYVRYGLKKIVQAIVNLNSYTKEFYEENCCYLFPCYEIQFLLERLKTQQESIETAHHGNGTSS